MVCFTACYHHPRGKHSLSFSSCLPYIEIARELSADFKFVRVDLYDINGRVYFGELTFSPTNGVFSHYTQEFLNEMGSKLVI